MINLMVLSLINMSEPLDYVAIPEKGILCLYYIQYELNLHGISFTRQFCLAELSWNNVILSSSYWRNVIYGNAFQGLDIIA